MFIDVQSKSKTLHQPHRPVLHFFQTENIQEIKESTLPFIQIEKKISKRTLLIVIYTNNASEEQCKAVYKLGNKFLNIYAQS